MEIKTILVVGAGTMGAGVAQLAAQQRFNVILSDVTLEIANKGKDKLKKGLAGRVEKGKMTQPEMDAILARIRTTGDPKAAQDADFIIESVAEDLEIKKRVFEELDRNSRPGVILATNTTSLSISAIASATTRPERVVQMHFFNPPVIMKLCEIMPGKKTSPEALQVAEELAKKLDKDPVVCRNEAPAGIVSRTLGALINEATWLLAQGVASAEDIDKAMRLGANHPMGPLALCDLIGLDVHRAKMQSLRQALNDPRYQHPEIVDRMIAEGKLGKKSGKGFYDYSEDKK